MQTNELEITSARILEWIKQNFPLATQRKVGFRDSLLESGVVDSLGTLEIIQFLEVEFGIQITDEEMVADHFESVHSISLLVGSKQL